MLRGSVFRWGADSQGARTLRSGTSYGDRRKALLRYGSPADDAKAATAPALLRRTATKKWCRMMLRSRVE